MTNNLFIKSLLAQKALNFIPPLVRKTLIEDIKFLNEYELKADCVITFNEPNVTIQRSELFDAVRQYLPYESISVTDKKGSKWQLKNLNKEAEIPQFALSLGTQNLPLPTVLACICPDKTVRLRYLDEISTDVNLPVHAREKWHKILSQRAFEDEEVDDFNNDICDTPTEMARSIYEELLNGQISIFSLVPSSRRYYERLIGEFDGSLSIKDYAISSGKSLLKQLSDWNSYDGFLFSLFLSAHSNLTSEIEIGVLESEDVLRAFDYVEKYGDTISQIGAIEVGLGLTSSIPEIMPIISHLVEQIRDDDVNGQNSGFKLISALFFLVDGELSRTGLFSSCMPFYRRLASLSQVALIHRQLLRLGIDIDSFCEWALQYPVQQYYLQSLADMRIEPRWYPDLASPSQIKENFVGRIIIAAVNTGKDNLSRELYDLILDTNPTSLFSVINFPFPFFPGPLEGAANTGNILPDEVAQSIENQLGKPEIEPSSFIALMNSALIFNIRADYAELAAKILKFGNYRLTNVTDRLQLITILNGLATVAGVTRSGKLADELRLLVRRYSNDAQYTLSIDEILRICLVSASSRADLMEWKNFVGDWLTELSFSNLKDEEAKFLYSELSCLCNIVPELWFSCSRAKAALMTYVS